MSSEQPDDRTAGPDPRVVIIGQDGMAKSGDGPGGAEDRDGGGDGGDGERNITELVAQPAKVMRIGGMIRQLLEEVKAAPLDEASRARLADIYASSITELEAGLAPELVEGLERPSLPFSSEVPSEAELRIAQAQLVGWLEGLFHGIQTAIMAQQMAARAQLEELRRRALPPGSHDGGQAVIVGPGGQMIMPPGVRLTPSSGEEEEHGGRGTGQYL